MTAQDSTELGEFSGALSASGEAFLEFARRDSDCRTLAGFEDLLADGGLLNASLQPWPAFLDPLQVAEAARAASELAGLVRSVPGRVFADDLGGLAAFYRLEELSARMLQTALDDPAKLQGSIARPDFIRTAEGFRCLECNMGGALGGWDVAYRAQAYLKVPAIARWVAELGREVSCPKVFDRLFTHILGASLRRFRTRRLHLGLLLPLSPEAARQLEVFLTGELRELLGRLGGLEGSIRVIADDSELSTRDGQLFLRGERVHALVEAATSASSAAVYRSWIAGNVLLYNGGLTPLLTDKRNLALLSELADSGLFGEAERAAIDRLVPWTRRVSNDPAGRWPASGVDRGRLIRERERLVLKPGGGLGGADVFLGSETPVEDWAVVVERAFEEGDWVAQERVESLPFVFHGGDFHGGVSGGAPHDAIWSFFVFGKTYGGCMVRCLPRAVGGVVNVHRGARVAPVFEVAEASA